MSLATLPQISCRNDECPSALPARATDAWQRGRALGLRGEARHRFVGCRGPARHLPTRAPTALRRAGRATADIAERDEAPSAPALPPRLPTATHKMAALARPPRPPPPPAAARAGCPTHLPSARAGREAGRGRPGAAVRGKVCPRCPGYIRRRCGAARLPHGGARHGRAAFQAAPRHAARLPGAPPAARQPREAELPARRGGRPLRGHRRPAGARLLPTGAGKAAGRDGAGRPREAAEGAAESPPRPDRAAAGQRGKEAAREPGLSRV